MDETTADRWMETAFSLALEARGTTLPNPAVGCVVLDKTGKPVGRAATSPEGRPHAERKALEQAGAKARGGTLVVTLEPCVAFPGKKSPPCAAAAILAGIETVVVGATDPNPHVAGRGIHALRKSGMKVLERPLDGRVPDFYAGFGHFLATGKPRVTLKIAISSDGNMASAPGVRTAITGDESRRFVHSLRARSDLVVVGGGTVLADDPELTVRDAPGRSPRRLALWPVRGIPAEAKIWHLPENVFAAGASTRPDSLPSRIEWVQIPSSPEGLDLPELLDWCAKRNLHDVLVEPGPKLLGQMLKLGLWDELWVLRAAKPLPGGLPADPRNLLPSHPATQERVFGTDLARLWRREL